MQLFLNKQTKVNDKNNQLLMQWGQFVAHDVSSLAIDSNYDGIVLLIVVYCVCVQDMYVSCIQLVDIEILKFPEIH